MVYLYLYLGLIPLWLFFLGFAAAKENMDFDVHKVPMVLTSVVWPVFAIVIILVLIADYGFKLGGGKK